MMSHGGCLAALFGRRQGSGSSHEKEMAGDEGEDETVLFEEEELGEAELEARGDWFHARARRRSSWWYVVFSCYPKHVVIAQDLKEAALCYVHANKWRKAAVAYGEQAIALLKTFEHMRDEVKVAYALLDSTRCYKKISNKDDSEIAAAKLAIQTSFGFFTKRNYMQYQAATCCRELAELYEEQREWNKAVHYFEEAKNYYGNTSDNGSYCSDKVRKIGYMVASAKLIQP